MPDQVPPTYCEQIPADAMACDVLVVGAGASGIPAAIAAARQGARVVLLEEDLSPGGAPVDMYVTFLCGGPRVGIFLEMANRLNQRFNLTGQPATPFHEAGFNDGREYWYLPSAYLQMIHEMLAAEPNLHLICGAQVTGVLVKSDGVRTRVRGVLAEGAAGQRRAFVAPVTIDATGTGALAALAGCACQYGRNARSDFDEPYGPETADAKVQRCTWMFISQRLQPGAVLPRERIGGGVVESNHGWLDTFDDAARARNTGVYLHWGATVDCEDTRDPQALARAQQEAQELLKPVLATMTAHGYAMHLAPKLGVREVRRVMGETVVTVNDLMRDTYPDDVIAQSEFGLDAWGENIHPDQHQLPRAGIPYRALIPRNTEGLLVAGKAISGTHLAMSSYRVQPIVASIGTAAGIAAALAARDRTDVRAIAVDELQQQLRAMGVI